MKWLAVAVGVIGTVVVVNRICGVLHDVECLAQNDSRVRLLGVYSREGLRVRQVRVIALGLLGHNLDEFRLCDRE